MRKRCFTLFLTLFVFSFTSFAPALAASNLEEGVGQLAQQISKSMQEKQKQKIAIIDFSDLNGNVTSLGQFMAEELTTQLFMVAPGKFEVVERRQLMKLEDELMLGQTGFIEEKSIKKMGQVLGVDAIVTGSMTDLGNTVKINARLIGVESAKVFAVAATDIPKTGMVADLIAKQVEKRPGVIQPTTANSSQVKQEAKGVQGTDKVFQNDFLKIIVKSLKKAGKTINLVLVYENITDKDYAVRAYSGETYLLDENGEKWKNRENSAINYSSYGSGTVLLPNTKLNAKLTFEPKEDVGGKAFSFISSHTYMLPTGGFKEFSVVINDIPAE